MVVVGVCYFFTCFSVVVLLRSHVLLFTVLGVLNSPHSFILNLLDPIPFVDEFTQISNSLLEDTVGLLSSLTVLDFDRESTRIRNLVYGRPDPVPRTEDRQDSVRVEEHTPKTFDDAVTGQLLEEGEGGYAEHGVATLGYLELTHALPSCGVVAQLVVEVEGIEIVVTGDSDAPDIRHVGEVLLTERSVAG